MSNRIAHLVAPWRTMQALQDEFDSQFRRLWNSVPVGDVSGEITIWQNDDGAVVELTAPGFEAENFEISVHGRKVSVSASRSRVESSQDERWVQDELAGESYSRSVQLPFEVDSARTEATYRNGMLSLQLKKSEADKPQLISVNAG